MLAVDTNVLVRLFVEDDEAEAGHARALARAEVLWVSHVVLAEISWVLTSLYDFSREALAGVVERMLEGQRFEVQEPAVVAAALKDYRESKAGFADCLILEIARSQSVTPLATFDGKLSKLSGTRKLGPKKR